MTAVSLTLVKNEAAKEKNVAEPPSASVTSPNGVRTLSSARVPVTRRSATTLAPASRRAPGGAERGCEPAGPRGRRRPGGREVLPDQEVEPPARRLRERGRGRDHGVAQEPGAGA